ncbi:IgGFc-binding protein [Paraliomyxa miuraensis]|uniref:IgGFc-binding protein n=1 Tax=Paraliomyxa miuraensis TaxID=376150 RepID=UPI00225BB9E9|nr:IgGFc-binding protein [Paraliomyxa miuraensis]MCX4242230.1 IgGFc-binding protein [Paraliomyxa miuraensis]
MAPSAPAQAEGSTTTPRRGAMLPLPLPLPDLALTLGALTLGALALTGCPNDPPPGTATESESESDPTVTSGPATVDDTGPVFICEPGEKQCNGQQFIQTCAPTGLEWIQEPCSTNETCDPCTEDETCAEDKCVGLCEVEAELPSSAGCSFIANRQLHLNVDSPDGLIVTNPNEDLPVTVQLYRTPEGKRKEEAVGNPRVLQPGENTLYELTADFVLGTSSMFRTGGTYRVESDVPVVAYLHSPLTNSRGNDSSMLLPETTLGRHYVVPSFSPHAEQQQGQGQPSYFEIVATEDFTEVTWTPPVDTAGTGINIDFVAAGDESPVLNMNRFDTVRIAASANFQENPDLRDVSGTVIESNHPIWVVGASRCSRVPVLDEPPLGRCDPLQELLIPLDYWGSRYVAAHSPDRGTERHWWRIYSANEGTRITAEGNLGCPDDILTAENCPAPNEFDGEACTFAARGSWIQVDVPNGCSFFLDSTNDQGISSGAFMPVQYLQGSRFQENPAESTEIGDPAMYQMVPVEQFLNRYVFSTGLGFDFHYVQVIRQIGGPTVFLDNMSVNGYSPVNDTWEVANFPISEGPHVIDSGAPFGIVQIGYSSNEPSENCDNTVDPQPICHASYAYPGGMKSEVIYIP